MCLNCFNKMYPCFIINHYWALSLTGTMVTIGHMLKLHQCVDSQHQYVHMFKGHLPGLQGTPREHLTIVILDLNSVALDFGVKGGNLTLLNTILNIQILKYLKRKWLLLNVMHQPLGLRIKLLMMCQNLHWLFEAVSKSSGNDNISATKWLPE